jgi:hypothetical protein
MNLRYFTVIVLPALGILYGVLTLTDAVPAGVPVLVGIFCLELFLAAIMHRRWNIEYGGDIRVINTPEGKTYSLELYTDPYDLDDLTEVLFKVSSK